MNATDNVIRKSLVHAARKVMEDVRRTQTVAMLGDDVRVHMTPHEDDPSPGLDFDYFREVSRSAQRPVKFDEDGLIFGGARIDAGQPLDELIREQQRPDGGAWVAFPTGLVIPLQSLNWIWRVPHDRLGFVYYLGTAEQADRFCRRRGVNPALVLAVPQQDMHGTCVLEEGPGIRTDRNDYRLVQAWSFP